MDIFNLMELLFFLSGVKAVADKSFDGNELEVKELYLKECKTDEDKQRVEAFFNFYKDVKALFVNGVTH